MIEIARLIAEIVMFVVALGAGIFFCAMCLFAILIGYCIYKDYSGDEE